MIKGLLFFPILSCLNRIGKPIERNTIHERITNIGNNKTKIIIERKISKKLFIHLYTT